jgi:hypothetical protein
MAETSHTDPSSLWTVVVGVIGFLIVAIFIIGIQAIFYQTENREIQEKIVSQAPARLTSIRAEQESHLNSYKMIDSNSGVVAIPIDRAMELVVEDYRR